MTKEEAYNKWQMQDIDIDLIDNERYQFTKSELLNFAEFYYQSQQQNKVEEIPFVSGFRPKTNVNQQDKL